MTDLQKLVERYAMTGELDFQAFRSAFVMDYLTVCEDPAIWAEVLQIESDCDDFERGLMSEQQLRQNLVAKCSTVCGTATGVVCQRIPQSIASNISYSSGSFTVLQPVQSGSARQLAGVTLAWEFA